MPDKALCLLDNLRHSNGGGVLGAYFAELLKKDGKRALELINDPTLRFGTLFELGSAFQAHGMRNALNPLYRDALRIASELIANPERHAEYRLRSGGADTCNALKWILYTGYDDRDDGSIGLVLERSAALLVKSFGDAEALPYIVEMIFRKNRSGSPIHDLVWIFFEARRPKSLALIAQRLLSQDTRDIALSQKLLGFIPCVAENMRIKNDMLYGKVMDWLAENLPFLRYTGESLHMSGKPLFYTVDTYAKYLCRPISADDGESGSPTGLINQYESGLLKEFAKLPEGRRKLLADFSYKLYRTDFSRWCGWMLLPPSGQADLAEHYAGGSV